MNAATEQLLIDYARLKELAFNQEGASLPCADFTKRGYKVLTDFLPSRFLTDLETQYDLSANEFDTSSDDLPDFLKTQLRFPDQLRHLIWELHSGAFIEYLEKITATELLLPDPHLYRGGLLLQREDDSVPHVTLGFSLQPLNFINRVSLLINLSNEHNGRCLITGDGSDGGNQEVDYSPRSCVVFKPTRETEVEFHCNAQSNSAEQNVLLLHYYNVIPETTRAQDRRTLA